MRVAELLWGSNSGMAVSTWGGGMTEKHANQHTRCSERHPPAFVSACRLSMLAGLDSPAHLFSQPA